MKDNKSMKKSVLSLIAIASISAFGATFTGVELDVSALPKEKAFIGRMVRTRILPMPI